MAKIYGIRWALGVGPRLAAAIRAARETVAGELDQRTSIARELKQHMSNGFPHRTPRQVQEISERRFPLALRPQIVTNGKGGWMTWDAWLKSPVLEFKDMIFEDGTVIRG